jgi:hypothetical protein
MKIDRTDLVKRGFALFPWGWVRSSGNTPLIRCSVVPVLKYWVELGNGYRIKLDTVEKLDTFLSLCDDDNTF